jgi:D-aspartate ligase
MTDKKAILLIGYDTNLCLGVLFCLRNAGYHIYLLTSNKNNAAKYSRFLKGIHYYDQTTDQLQNILTICNEKNIDLIMPIDEMEIRFVNEHKLILEKQAKCTWTTETSLFDIGINKGLLADFLTKHKLPCPRFATVNNADELKEVSAAIGFPILIKPNRGSFGRMIKRFETAEELMAYYMEFAGKDGDFIIQPFIIGSDITCNVICKQGEVICHTIQESPVKTGSDFSSNDILEFHDDPEVIDAVAKMMKLLNWNGVACVDIRRDQKDQLIYILEINGRFWASTVASYLKAGINFPLTIAKLAFGETLTIPTQKPARQISIGQYKAALFSGKYAFKDTKYISYLADPLARLFQVMKF